MKTFELDELGFDVRVAANSDMSEADVREYFARDVEHIWPGTTTEEGYDVDALTAEAVRRMADYRRNH